MKTVCQRFSYFLPLLVLCFAIACNNTPSSTEVTGNTPPPTSDAKHGEANPDKYVTVRLTADLSQLSDNQKNMLPLLIQAAQIMDDCFWYEAYGDKASLLKDLDNERLRAFAAINYGPWDRLDDNKPFLPGIGDKPAGANFYPHDMTKEEFEAADLAGKESLYTLIRRDQAGNLMTVPYREHFKEPMQQAA